jgi:hypothetical protein
VRNSYSLLHPAALAVSGGAGALALALLHGLGVLGAGSMMGGGWMMGDYGPYGYPYHMTIGGGFFMLLWAIVAGAFGGWIVAVVYNAIVRQVAARSDSATGLPVRSTPAGSGDS